MVVLLLLLPPPGDDVIHTSRVLAPLRHTSCPCSSSHALLDCPLLVPAVREYFWDKENKDRLHQLSELLKKGSGMPTIPSFSRGTLLTDSQ